MRSWSDPVVRTVVTGVVAGVRSRLSERSDRSGLEAGGLVDQLDRDELAGLVATEVRRLRTDDLVLPIELGPDERQDIWLTARHAALAELAGQGRLQPLLDDDSVQDIHVNGTDPVWVVGVDGVKQQVDPVADTDDDLVELGRRITRHLYGPEGEQEWSKTAPVAEVTLASGHRVELVRDVTLHPSLTIRRPDLTLRHLSQLTALGSVHEQVGEFLSSAVRHGANVLVAGGTGAGKTTTMRALINEIPPSERVITVEDTRELCITHTSMTDAGGVPLHPNAVEIITRHANAEGAGGFSLAEALRTSKRMDPDRLIVGEVRSVEAHEMVDAMLGEAGGSLCTVHAESARAALNRLVYLAANTSDLAERTARQMVADAVDVVAWQRRDPATGRRYVAEVVEVDGIDDDVLRLHVAWLVGPDGRLLAADGPTQRMRDRLAAHGAHPRLRAVRA